MKEDPVYRQNQKDSNQTWRENHPDYWKDYRKRHPDKAEHNRLRQQVRNQKRQKSDHPVVEADHQKIAKMVLVDRADELQEKGLWLVSGGGRIPPIKLVLISNPNKPGQAKTQHPVF